VTRRLLPTARSAPAGPTRFHRRRPGPRQQRLPVLVRNLQWRSWRPAFWPRSAPRVPYSYHQRIRNPRLHVVQRFVTSTVPRNAVGRCWSRHGHVAAVGEKPRSGWARSGHIQHLRLRNDPPHGGCFVSYAAANHDSQPRRRHQRRRRWLRCHQRLLTNSDSGGGGGVRACAEIPHVCAVKVQTRLGRRSRRTVGRAGLE